MTLKWKRQVRLRFLSRNPGQLASFPDIQVETLDELIDFITTLQRTVDRLRHDYILFQLNPGDHLLSHGTEG